MVAPSALAVVARTDYGIPQCFPSPLPSDCLVAEEKSGPQML
jgi:hypothetical protein